MNYVFLKEFIRFYKGSGAPKCSQNHSSRIVNYDFSMEMARFCKVFLHPIHPVISVKGITRFYKVLEQKVIFHEFVVCHFLTRFYKGLGDREL